MPDAKSQDVGLYNASAPALAVGQYSTVDALNDVTAGLTSQNSGRASLSSNHTADAWYQLEEKINKAVERLAGVNDEFLRQIKAMDEALKGESGEAFQKYAKDLHRESEELYHTLESKKYGTTVGN